ncbi:MAG: hypothetical protein JWO06_3989 [Bacteroidota bacterium]|nr:hypothetical protein [Bacteroidota bacterium]
MKSSLLKFFIAVVVITVACIALQSVWNSQVPEKMKLEHGPVLLAVFPLAAIAVHLFLLNSAKGSGQFFIRGFMLSTVLKFFVYLTVLIGFLLYTPGNKQGLIIHFLFYYVVFTVLEVSMLYKQLSKMGKESKEGSK